MPGEISLSKLLKENITAVADGDIMAIKSVISLYADIIAAVGTKEHVLVQTCVRVKTVTREHTVPVRLPVPILGLVIRATAVVIIACVPTVSHLRIQDRRETA